MKISKVTDYAALIARVNVSMKSNSNRLLNSLHVALILYDIVFLLSYGCIVALQLLCSCCRMVVGMLYMNCALAVVWLYGCKRLYWL